MIKKEQLTEDIIYTIHKFNFLQESNGDFRRIKIKDSEETYTKKELEESFSQEDIYDMKHKCHSNLWMNQNSETLEKLFKEIKSLIKWKTFSKGETINVFPFMNIKCYMGDSVDVNPLTDKPYDQKDFNIEWNDISSRRGVADKKIDLVVGIFIDKLKRLLDYKDPYKNIKYLGKGNL